MAPLTTWSSSFLLLLLLLLSLLSLLSLLFLVRLVFNCGPAKPRARARAGESDDAFSLGSSACLGEGCLGLWCVKMTAGIGNRK